MLTIDALRAYGADVDDGLRRCMNNEGFYLKLVEKAAADPEESPRAIPAAEKAAVDPEESLRAIPAAGRFFPCPRPQ